MLGALTLVGMAAVTTVSDLLDGQVSLDIECVDRIYLNGDVPNLQVGGRVVSFMTAHLKRPIRSLAILEKIGAAFHRVSRLLGVVHTSNQMSYDLGRLRLNGLIERLEGTNTYLPTAEGQRVAIFHTKVHNRLLRPLLAADGPPAPPELRHALHTIDRHMHGHINDAWLGNAA